MTTKTLAQLFFAGRKAEREFNSQLAVALETNAHDQITDIADKIAAKFPVKMVEVLDSFTGKKSETDSNRAARNSELSSLRNAIARACKKNGSVKLTVKTDEQTGKLAVLPASAKPVDPKAPVLSPEAKRHLAALQHVTDRIVAGDPIYLRAVRAALEQAASKLQAKA